MAMVSWANPHTSTRPKLRNAMEPILREIDNALAAKQWYAAVMITLTLPDICASLEAGPGATEKKNKKRYKDWCRKNLPDLPIESEVLWDLRNGVVHHGRYILKPRKQFYSRIGFTIPNGLNINNLIVECDEGSVCCFEIGQFCKYISQNARLWYERKRHIASIRFGVEHLVQLRPNGLMPIFNNIPFVG